MSWYNLIILIPIAFLVWAFFYLRKLMNRPISVAYEIKMIRMKYARLFAMYESLTFDQYLALKKAEEKEIDEIKMKAEEK